MGLKFCSIGSHSSPQTARSGKFLKLLKGTSTPSQETILDIDKKTPSVAALFYSPFWRVMYSLEINESNPPFESLDINVQQLIFEPKRDKLGKLQPNGLYKKEIVEIFKVGSLSALSCLVLLRNQFNKNHCHFSKGYLDKLIRYCYTNVCATNKLPALQWEIFEQILGWLKRNTHIEIKRAPSSVEKLAALTKQKVAMISLFSRKVKTSMTDEEITLLASLTSLANEKLVYQELSQLNEQHQIKTLMPKDEDGLYWVISKFNASNVRSEYVQLIQTTQHIQIAYPT
jgi:hypothetical protein